MKKGALIIILFMAVNAPFSFCADPTLVALSQEQVAVLQSIDDHLVEALGQGGGNSDYLVTNDLLRIQNYLLLFGCGILLFIVYRTK